MFHRVKNRRAPRSRVRHSEALRAAEQADRVSQAEIAARWERNMLDALLYELAGMVSHERMKDIIDGVGLEPPHLIDELWKRYLIQRRLYNEDTDEQDGNGASASEE